MSYEQVENNAKGTAADATKQTKQFGEEKIGMAQEQAQGFGKTVQDKTGNAQQSAADSGKAAQDKAAEAKKDESGNVLEQAGNKLTETFNSVKGAVSGGNR